MKPTNYHLFDFLDFDTELSRNESLWKAYKPTAVYEKEGDIYVTVPFQKQKLANDMMADTDVPLFGVFWKRTTTLAANMALTLGTVFSIGVGILYLWVFPAEQYNAWPHFMLLSFYLFVIIGIGMIVVSLWDKSPQLGILNMEKIEDKPARIVLILWGLLIVTMIGLYIFFNGH